MNYWGTEKNMHREANEWNGRKRGRGGGGGWGVLKEHLGERIETRTQETCAMQPHPIKGGILKRKLKQDRNGQR